MQLKRTIAALVGIGAVTAGATPAMADVDTGTLTGSVRDTRGAVVADAHIIVYPDDTSGSSVAETTTDAAGRFRVPDLDVGRYKVQIGLGGWSEWAPGRHDESTAVAYPVAAGRRTNVASIVTAPGVISGRLRTAEGGPAANVRVSADDYNTARVWAATTAADGTYALRVPPSDNYVVSFVDGNFHQYALHTVDQAQARHYTVVSGRTLRVNDQLLPAASLTGRLVDAAGAPVAGANVSFVYTETAHELATTTDGDGRYRFDKVSPGPVKVRFTAADGRQQWAHQKLSWDEAEEFVLELGAVTTVNDTLLP